MSTGPHAQEKSVTPWRNPALLVAVTGAAALLQATRTPFRWNQICVAYASYFKEYQHNIEVEGWTAAFTQFVGLHPPLYSLFFHAQESFALPPLAWLSFSGLLSVASVPLTWFTMRMLFPREAKLAWTAAIVLAVSPHRVAYGLEVNNYPLMVFICSAQFLSFAGFAASLTSDRGACRKRGLWWAIATAFAMWTHVLCITLPLSQLSVILLVPTFRKHLKTAVLWLLLAAIPCLPLLPTLLSRGEAPPINETVGLAVGLESLFVGFPGRYGSTWGAYLLGLVGLLGSWTLLRLPVPERLLGLALVCHLGLAGAAILLMVSLGIAASHQYPYYLVLVPTASIVIAAGTSQLGAGLVSRVAIVLLTAGLCLHAASLGSDALKGQENLRSAVTERALMALAIDEWEAGSTLVLIDFPNWGDDDKDILDPTWALLPKTEPVDFAHPGVPTLVTADPYWGQPVRFNGERWLYTFTGWPPSDGPLSRMDAIANHVLATDGKLIVAVYNTNQAYGDFAKVEAWAMRRGELGRSAPAQALWVLTPGES